MRNLKIGTRLALGFVLIILLLLIMSSIGAWRMLSTQQENANLQERQQANALILRWARQVEVNATQSLAAANLTNPDILRLFKQALEVSEKEANQISVQLKPLIRSPEAMALFQQISETQEKYKQGRNQAFKDLDNGDYAEADAFFSKEMPQLTEQYIAQIDRLSKLQDDNVRATFSESHDNNNLGLILLAAATLLALLVGPLFAWLVSRSITRPLGHAVSLASLVARRDLSRDIRPQGKDEVTQLENALHHMVTGLRQTVGEVRTGANSIASAAAQITTGNLDLSSRTEEQASSLAQTAATMEQITATVRQNADNTQQANTLASSAAKTATDGGAIVSELVSTMGDINSRSQQVADIIGVIDSIAFQTNILALNAAVEAARAGEQGRGFAVVASEVRALAQRSAGAAREIKDLIDTSVQATTKGNEQAARAGATMQDIVDGINRVTDIMGEINAANREQTTGIEEINSAVTQMDDVTRQNASLVEESAAAAGSLQEQANTLAQLVATFNLDGQSQADTPRGTSHSQKAQGTSAGQQNQTQTQPPAQAPRIPSAPAKVVSPPPRTQRSTPPAKNGGTQSTNTRPALRAPAQPAPSETEEWTEF